MIIRKTKDFIRNELSGIYNQNEIQAFINIIFEKSLNMSATEVIMNEYSEIPQEKFSEIKRIVEKLKQNCPIQYIFNSAYFYGREFYVDNNVLIPRQETELLVDIIVKENEIVSPKILDIGTGSGIIAVSLAKNILNSECFACDISETALNIATKNADIHNADIKFFKCDILNIENLPFKNLKFDIIVSNPPYVTKSENVFMNKNVLDYEPWQALFVPDDNPLVFYEKIAKLSLKYLKNKGKIYFEINERFPSQIQQLLISLGYRNVRTIKDLNGKYRIVAAENKSLSV